MTGNSFAFESPGRGAWADMHHHHHHHRHADDEIRDEGGQGRHGGGRHGRHGGGPRGGRAAKAQLARELARQWAFARAKHGPGGLGRPSPEELEELIALRRMRGGPFGGTGPFGPRGRGRGRGGRRRRGDVRLAVLRLLAENPSNGYQLMQAIEERSGGRWRPSPGSMYPTLAQLEDEGFVRAVDGSNPKLIEITDAGRSHLETRGGEPDPWASDDDDEDGLTELAPLVIGLGKAAWQVASVGSESQRARAVELLSEARRGLYGILAEDPDGTQSGDAAPDEDASSEDDEPSTTV
jgi:DNA-binding PadR family transcriptional regulator